MTKKAADAADVGQEEEKSLRDSISEAFENDDEPKVEATDGQKAENQEEAVAEEAPKETQKKEDDSQDSDKPPASADGGDNQSDDSSADSSENELGKKAPVGWPPKAREHWSKLPQEVREQIAKRERDIAVSMQDTSGARKTHSFVSELANQYKPIMDAEGVSDPLQAISGLFKTVAELRVGSPQQKAERMARLISHYGIDIQALDSALAGEPSTTPEEQALASMIDQRMAPVNQLLQQLQQRQYSAAQQSQAEAEKAVAAFKGEFLSDVRMDMADLIDMAASRGQNMTLQEAYDKAVLLRPDIQAVLTERKQQEELLGQQNMLQSKRDASSSLVGKQGGHQSRSDGSIRGEIEAAWGETDRV